jgi:antitoxin VapB
VKAKIFKTGRSQAVRLPLAFRFDTPEVFIRRGASGEVILSTRPEKKPWKKIFAELDSAEVPKDFLSDRDKSATVERDLF